MPIQDSEFEVIIDGGTPPGRETVVTGSVAGSLGGPDTLISIVLNLRPPASDNANPEVSHTFRHSHLALDFNLSAPPDPEILGQAIGSSDWLVL